MPRVSRLPVPAVRGFTLVELLVVLGLLGALLAMTLPTAAQSRRQSMMTRDTDGLHRIGVALGAYAADSKSLVPHRSPMPETDGPGHIGPGNSGRIAGLSAMSVRSNGSQLLRAEDGFVTADSINVPTGLGQLAGRVALRPTQPQTTYSTTAAYLTPQELFAVSDRQDLLPNRTPARNHWWRFADVALRSPVSPWAYNPNYNALNWPSVPADAIEAGTNSFFRTSWAWRSADFARANDDDSLTPDNDPRNLRTDAEARHDKVVVMSRDPYTINTFGRGYSLGAHMLYNDGTTGFSRSIYWRQGMFTSAASFVVLPSGRRPTRNPYTLEVGVQSYKLSHTFAYADKYMAREAIQP